MPGTPLQYPFYGATVTAPTGTAANLLTLLRALGGKYANLPGSAYSVQLQPDPNNGANILVGDENVAVSPQQCAANLEPATGDSVTGSVPYIAPLGSIWVIAAGAGAALLNVAVFQ